MQPGHHRTPVGKIDPHDGRANVDAIAHLRLESDRRPAHGDQGSIGAVDRYVGADRFVEPRHRRGDLPGVVVTGGDIPILEPDMHGAQTLARALADQRPERAHQERDRDKARQQRQIDLPEQAAAHDDHDSPSCFLAKT